MSNNLDQLFKKALEGRTYEPPVQMWDNISRQLDKRRKKRKIVFWWPAAAAAAAVIVLFFSLSYLLTYHQEYAYENQALLSEKLLLLNDQKILQPGSSGIALLLSEKVHMPEILPLKEEKNPFIKIETAEKKQFIQDGVKIAPLPYYNINTHTIRKEVIPLINQQAYKNNRLYNELLSEKRDLLKNNFAKEKKELNLSLSGHFTPGYATGKYTSGKNGSPTYGYAKDQLDGIFSMSGGFKITMSTGRRLFFQTGLIYTQTGQASKGNRVYASGVALFGAGNNKAYVSSPLGRIRSKSREIMYQASLSSMSMARVQGSNIEQVFGAMEIPLALKYKIYTNRLSFTVLGGFSGSFIVSNKAYLNTGNKREYIGRTEDIRNFNISTDFSLGMEYPLTSKIKIMMEPGIRYYLQSVSRNGEIDFKPCLFSFSTGIGIDF